MPPLIFRKGLDLKHEVADTLAASYHSDLIDAVKNADFRGALWTACSAQRVGQKLVAKTQTEIRPIQLTNPAADRLFLGD